MEIPAAALRQGGPARERAILKAKAPRAPERLTAELVAFVQRLRKLDLFKSPGVAETLDWASALTELDAVSLDPAQVIRGEFKDRNPKTSEILLVTDVLVRGNEDFESAFGQPQQLAIFDAAPPARLGRSAFMANEKFVHRPGNALVQQDFHAGISNADSDRSKIRRAISLVTEGKHSKNSSSE